MVRPKIRKGKIKKGDAQLKFKTDRNKGWIHTCFTIFCIGMLVFLGIVFCVVIVAKIFPEVLCIDENFADKYITIFASLFVGGIMSYAISIFFQNKQ